MRALSHGVIISYAAYINESVAQNVIAKETTGVMEIIIIIIITKTIIMIIVHFKFSCSS